MPIALSPLNSDTFQRANENPLNGTNWNANNPTNLAVVSDVCITGYTFGGLCWQTFKQSAPNDQYAQASVVAMVNSNPSISLIGFMLRAASIANSFYRLLAGSPGSLNQATQIQIINSGGVQTVLAQAPPSAVVGDTWAFAAVGTTLVAAQNGQLVTSVTDSTYSSGSTGLVVQRASSNPDTGVINFEMGSSAFVESGPTTVTGNVKVLLNLPPNTTFPSEGTVRFRLVLPPRINQTATTTGNNQILNQPDGDLLGLPTIIDTPIDSQGNFSVTLQGNNLVLPAGTLYEVSYLIPGIRFVPQFYNVNGPFVIGSGPSVVNLNNTPPVQPPSAS